VVGGRIIMMKIIPSIKLPIIKNGDSSNHILSDITKNKKIIIFGVPGAFTPTCSEKHLPGFINLYNQFQAKGIHDIYCLSVNDVFVMKAWLESYPKGYLINGIADGNADFAKTMQLTIDYSGGFMGTRCKRFTLLADQNNIVKLFIEEKGEYFVSSAENILNNI
jgi:peroxiredoxin